MEQKKFESLCEEFFDYAKTVTNDEDSFKCLIVSIGLLKTAEMGVENLSQEAEDAMLSAVYTVMGVDYRKEIAKA